MSDDLKGIDSQLSKLEWAIAQAYRAAEEATLADGSPFIRLPAESIAGFRRELDRLKSGLFGTGERATLRLVCELHDSIRIRLIYLGQLLTHDVPRAYVDEALREYGTAKPSAQTPTPAPRPVVARPGPEAADGGWLSVLGGLITALFARRPSARPSARRAAPSQAIAPGSARRDHVHEGGHRESELRLIYLHKLMEEDRLRLLGAGQRPARIEGDISIPGYIARFSARDFADNHFAVRSRKSREPIARTPEELRAKLAKRTQQS